MASKMGTWVPFDLDIIERIFIFAAGYLVSLFLTMIIILQRGTNIF